jgi:hypothetical protein
MELKDYLLKLENNLIVGGGRWVADFTESFWEHPVGGLTFDMVVTGQMRVRGFLISRFISWIAMPNYQAACFVYSQDPELKGLGKTLKAIKGFMKERELDWSWLVIPRKEAFSQQAKAVVEKDESQELGIALVDLSSQEITSSRSYIGRRMPRFVKCFK